MSPDELLARLLQQAEEVGVKEGRLAELGGPDATGPSTKAARLLLFRFSFD